MILIFILYFLFASTFTLGKAALMYLPPFLLIAVRMTLGGIILLTYFFISKHHPIRIAKKDYWSFVTIVLFHIFFSYTLEFWGMEQVTSAKACLLYNLAPFFTALISYFFFSERLALRQILGLIVGFAGFIPVILAQAPGESSSAFLLSVHELALVLSVAASSYGWIVMKHLTHAGYSFIFVNGVAMLGGGILSGITSFILEGTPAMKELTSTMPLMVGFLSPAWNALLMLCACSVALIIIANIICYNLYGYLLSRYSPTFLSLAGLMTPLYAAALGWLFLGETVTWHFFATFVLIMIGMYLFYKGRPLVFEEKGL